MRNPLSRLAPLLLLMSCAGLTARQQALLPAMKMSWPPISADVRVGIQDGLSTNRLTVLQGAERITYVDRMDTAVAAGNAEDIAAIPWAPLSDEAHAGIDVRVRRGEISPGVGQSLKERVRNYAEAQLVFLQRR